MQKITYSNNIVKNNDDFNTNENIVFNDHYVIENKKTHNITEMIDLTYILINENENLIT